MKGLRQEVRNEEAIPGQGEIPVQVLNRHKPTKKDATYYLKYYPKK